MAGLDHLVVWLSSVKPKIAIVGAGWAGLAAAVELAPLARVSLFEAGREPGGRARRVRAEPLTLDNGQHILLGAYAETLRLMRQVGVDPDRALLRLPLSWLQPDGIRMRCPRVPAPWHLLLGLIGAEGLSWSDKGRLMRALTRLALGRWRISADVTVLEWMKAHAQSDELLRAFWRPLVLSALNTPIEQASMRILAAVLRDSLGARRAASDMLLPRRDLSALFPDPACAWLARQGAALHFGRRVQSVRANDGAGVVLDGEVFDAAIVACAPYHAAPLLDDKNLTLAVKSMQFWPIYTVYLCFHSAPGLPGVMSGLKQGTAHWLFDRDALCGEPGLVAAVVSAPDVDALGSHHELVEGVLDDLRALVPLLPEVLWTRVLVDKRATFAARTGLSRPGIRLGVQSLYLAGDWVDPEYPATLEGAVRSGVAAARALKQDLKLKKRQDR